MKVEIRRSRTMSLLILSFDLSSNKIGRHLQYLLNSSSTSNYPHVASFCSSNDLFSSTGNDWSVILRQQLQHDCLSFYDLLGFIILVDVATTSPLHLQRLPLIRSLLVYLNEQHSFQSILAFVIHAHATNQLYTSSLTCFNLNLLLVNMYTSVHGLIFHCIDSIDNHQTYHSTIAERIASIFQPVSSLREEHNQRTNASVCTEFLQFIQHLLNDPQQKLLVLYHDNIHIRVRRTFHSGILIQRGQPTLLLQDSQSNRLDIWNSLEQRRTCSTLILNSSAIVAELLNQLIVHPCEQKLAMNQAYISGLRKRFPTIDRIDDEIIRGVELCQQIVTDK
jgi:hypothetical protein